MIVGYELKIRKMCYYALIPKVYIFKAIIRQTYWRGCNTKNTIKHTTILTFWGTYICVFNCFKIMHFAGIYEYILLHLCKNCTNTLKNNYTPLNAKQFCHVMTQICVNFTFVPPKIMKTKNNVNLKWTYTRLTCVGM